MHWTEWIMLLLAILFLIPFVFAIVALFSMLWLVLRRKPEDEFVPKRVETPLGIFEESDMWPPHWEGDYAGTEEYDVSITLWVEDVDGQLDPAFLALLPSLLQELPALERIAREKVDNLTDEHTLIGLSQQKDGMFSLDFAYGSDDAEGESVFVSFRENEVVDVGVVG